MGGFTAVVWPGGTSTAMKQLETMQRRGQQLREGGYGAVEWDDLIGRR